MKTSKELAIELLRYKNANEVLKDVISNKESKIWGFAQDAAIEFLQKKYKYLDITENEIEQFVLDITEIVIENTIKQLRKKEITNSAKIKWYLTMYPEKEIKLPYKLMYSIEKNNIKNTIAWFIDRFINNVRNLFDKRNKKNKLLDLHKKLYFNSIENGEELISSSLYKIA